MSSKKPLLMIVVIFILPIICATAYFMWLNPENIHTTNVGSLINPPINKATLISDAANNTGNNTHRWQLVLVHPGNCEYACETALARLASIQQALQKDIPRTEVALWTSASNKAQLAGVKTEQLHNLPADPWLGFAEDGSFVLVDPLGNIILSYALTADTSGIFRDLKKLLKVSQIG